MLTQIESILKNLPLGKKFTILLLLVFAWGVVFSGIVFATLLERNAQNEITSKSHVLLATLDSVRDYTGYKVKQELDNKLKSEFSPESIGPFAAREIFEKLRADKAYSDFFYKEATLNPTNVRDQADDFEIKIVERFRRETALKELTGSRSLEAEELFYIARPLRVTESSCLECHSTPDIAPKSMIERYGTTHGFGWKLNQIVGAQIISLPTSGLFQSTRQSFVLIMGPVVIVFATAILMVNFWLKRYVARPLNRMTRVAEAVSTGDTNAEFEAVSKDEVGTLATAFTRMKTSLTIAMKMLEPDK